MKEKFLILSIVLLMMMAPLITYGEITITSADKFCKYAHVTIEKYRIGMEAVISFVDELGGDSTELASMKDGFVSAESELQTACDAEDWPTITGTKASMKISVAAFKNAAGTELTGKGVEAKERVNTAWEENKDYLEGLLKEARELHRDRNLQIFDDYVSEAKEVIATLESYEMDTTDVEAKLSEIEEKRADFQDAMNDVVETCTGYWWLECKTETVVGEVVVGATEEYCDLEVSNYCTVRDGLKTDFQEFQDLVYAAAGY